ncbi:TetR/AcrR family transcriptional regulator [Aquibacillus koreensis]|uniref:TetR/AcrR family transcriptional regulator n=1 Tax=Aquibacillus koreensis TaxID=279446 RepID=A0A9X4ALA2_9BACI|nr:TetR/AcrR family transcriptional regulator [Aquibacillus koreensis]MCT2535423.1 TetR/AcrR family transcriptional regulator [Aquibacillus koreensis]MDC3422258.1 TetR/AcrR family transcriptional regulator [Aquibacillus koreensis]
MPKIVDHEKRKKQIAEATWQVILHKGMEGATVRNIAKEAGLSLGALRHYFSTQDELLVYAMKLVKENAMIRVNEIIKRDLPAKEKVIQVLLEIVPINKETMAEMEVWFAFTFYARHKEDVFGVEGDGIFKGVQNVIRYLDQSGMLREGLNKDIESEKLYAIVDGIALHAMLEPHRVNKDRIIQTLRNHIDSLCVSASN